MRVHIAVRSAARPAGRPAKAPPALVHEVVMLFAQWHEVVEFGSTAELEEHDVVEAVGSASAASVCHPAGLAPTRNDDPRRTDEWTLTGDDTLRHGPQSQQSTEVLARWYPNTFTVTFDNGAWTLYQSTDPEVLRGSYRVFRDQLAIEEASYPTLEFSDTVDEVGSITLTAVEPIAHAERFVWTTRKLTRIG